MLGAFGIYSFVYPFAILLMSFDWMQFGMEWMSRLLLPKFRTNVRRDEVLTSG